MEHKPISDSPVLKHFTFRDLFYAVGAVAAGVTLYNTIIHRLEQLERDSTREITELKIRQDNTDKAIVKMDHEGTTASKNGIYQESELSKENTKRLTAFEAKFSGLEDRFNTKFSTLEERVRSVDLKTERISANLDLLLIGSGVKPKANQ